MSQTRTRKRAEETLPLADLREQVVQVGMEALARGIVHGTAGNMSIRDPESRLIAISPSGIPYPDVTPADIVIVNDAGDIVDGRRKPSSETPLHTMVMRARPDVRAIVHTHSHYSTVVSCIRPYLPPILTEVCLVVGARVPVTRYGLTGTPDFGESVIEVLEPDSRAIILKNHGLICFGDSFAAALGIAEVVEEAARVYVNALAANGGREPELVPEALIPEMTERFRQTYGQ
ncbi:MAG: class aldolase [Thermomicrobiales bacterium]|jgi:L-fuculose-phosphate aldolase|nr:class aldolase [Thermomicrobiales bacterium]MDF3040157.1 class aldolase [Thermomicrobiales bacterium]